MEDQLSDVGAVSSALANYMTALNEIKKMMTEEPTFESNKAEFDSAWKSENATVFLGQYTKLISSVSAAVDSLNKYQEKIIK